MGAQTKKKSVSFSLTNEERALMESRVALHGFDTNSEYLLALMEVEMKLRLETLYDKPSRSMFFIIDHLTKRAAPSGARKAEK